MFFHRTRIWFPEHTWQLINNCKFSYRRSNTPFPTSIGTRPACGAQAYLLLERVYSLKLTVTNLIYRAKKMEMFKWQKRFFLYSATNPLGNYHQFFHTRRICKHSMESSSTLEEAKSSKLGRFSHSAMITYPLCLLFMQIIFISVFWLLYYRTWIERTL